RLLDHPVRRFDEQRCPARQLIEVLGDHHNPHRPVFLEDLRALFNAADKLPDDKKRQLRTAIKGMLLAISQEQL
ncbi:hypothetical protein NB860_034575, partial [Pseudomonas aeruginosa]|nr:hypothetical protein [Pseudomonas aeruginosa]